MYLNAITDIIIEKRNMIVSNWILLIFINKNTNGIVPITDDKNIFLNLLILFNNKLVDVKTI